MVCSYGQIDIEQGALSGALPEQVSMTDPRRYKVRMYKANSRAVAHEQSRQDAGMDYAEHLMVLRERKLQSYKMWVQVGKTEQARESSLEWVVEVSGRVFERHFHHLREHLLVGSALDEVGAIENVMWQMWAVR